MHLINLNNQTRKQSEKTTFILTYDVGTTGNKTCLYKIGKTLELINSSIGEYPLYITDDGGAEQMVDDWWSAICTGTKAVIAKTDLDPSHIKGIAFCCQMQGTIVVDADGRALRNPMIYLDGRSTKQIKKYLQHGLIRVNNLNILKLLDFLRITGAAPATPKDPLWKYHWIRDNEPEIFNKIHKWNK